jgi:hypothetical protein
MLDLCGRLGAVDQNQRISDWEIGLERSIKATAVRHIEGE